MLERCVREQLDDRSFELPHARPDILRDEPDDFFRQGHLEMVERCFLAQDRYTMLEVRRLDVRDHSPLETADEARFQPRDFRRRPVAGQNDLAASLVQRVEGVEELLLRRLLPLQEVDVVDEEQVGLTKSPAKLTRGAVLNRGNELVRELLRAQVGDPASRLVVQDLVRDRLHEMCLAKPGLTVDEQGVVDLAGCLCDSVRGGGRELVRLADYEVIEDVPLAQWWRVGAALLCRIF